MRRFPWVLTVLTVAALALLIALGTWQVRRLAWKEGLIAAADAAAAAPPAPLAEVLAGPAPEFRRVVADCPGLASAPYVELQSIDEGRAGSRLVSLCVFDPSRPPILVDRGFVADTVSARPPVGRAEAPTRIEGVLREPGGPSPLTPGPADGRFFARDAEAMAEALGRDGPVQPLTLFATVSSNPDWAALEPSAPPAAFSNNHLGYAMTWFGLAIVLLGFYIALLRRRLKG
ncbi:SURF1 family protein [Brevundimonas balnearis]|uniref:SURF1-like protein n=1 Tax=Brevundimonas balnearis TaxID=1572858 RepID=A0ABV6R462_9CAUL